MQYHFPLNFQTTPTQSVPVQLSPAAAEELGIGSRGGNVNVFIPPPHTWVHITSWGRANPPMHGRGFSVGMAWHSWSGRPEEAPVTYFIGGLFVPEPGWPGGAGAALSAPLPVNWRPPAYVAAQPPTPAVPGTTTSAGHRWSARPPPEVVEDARTALHQTASRRWR